MIRRRSTVFVAALAIMLVVPSSDALAHKPGDSGPVVTVLNSTALGGLGSGSTIGPDGALYVTNGNAGTLVRIDPRNGSETVVGSGLPLQVIGFGGAIDVAFVGHRAYVLVTAAGSDFGVPDAVMGIYRLERDGTFSVFADLGTWSAAHPPADPDWNAAQGLQYSLDVWHNGFVVADAHLGRLIRVDCGDRSVSWWRSPAPTRSPPVWKLPTARCSWPRPDPPRTSRRIQRSMRCDATDRRRWSARGPQTTRAIEASSSMSRWPSSPPVRTTAGPLGPGTASRERGQARRPEHG